MTREVLLVTKPFGPPWRDSSKNLARDLAVSGRRYRYRVLAPRGSPLPEGPIEVERIYRDLGSYQPALAQNLRVLARLVGPSQGEALYHFFHAPNPRTAKAAHQALRFQRRKRPVLHTACSLPSALTPLQESCFADRTLVLSAHTEGLMMRAGVPGVVRVDPCVPCPRKPEHSEREAARQALQLKDAPVVLFAGDLEMGRGAPVFVAAMPLIARQVPEAQYVLACRAKTAHSRMAEEELKALVRGCGLMDRTRFMGETDRMAELLLVADVQALPARSLEKKMDYPLVLLEGFARMLPAVVGDAPTLLEMAELPGSPCVSARSDAPDEVAARIVALLRDDHRRREMGRAARKLAETRFNPTEFATRCEALYDELLARR
ncbi:MAG: glycosyltransferase family 4 protein [Deltaproteobacteria bacterium]|nr:glycosyltransferase family 4 protein [Deltaproteobacteria bacterium]